MTEDWTATLPRKRMGARVLLSDPAGRIRLPAEELRSWAWCTGPEAATRLSALLARRLTAAIEARAAGTVAYLEDGFALS
ncbi:hypothetical protein [Actinoplanes palleronii]|uniref:Uncharacterized protein n=1 Tax=Actinoplanes palleronii TaxID=113570 RepID=A0ABQ4BTF8_9ACTN|nr:hypothetical protein [Actinoplanes palleronii]GIE73937.1 hypothetical protein Apa02nite_100450 [Actinoplanes palleronii]